MCEQHSSLFISFAKVLYGPISLCQSQEKNYKISIGEDVHPITHLFFDDDILLFCRAHKEEVKKLKIL